MINSLWRKITPYLHPLRLVYPAFCRSCNILLDTDIPLCDGCSKYIQPLASTLLPVTKKVAVRVVAVGKYDSPLREIILRKLVSDRSASIHLAQLIVQHIPVEQLHIDVLIPVPLHWYRYAMRGYNQAAVIAGVLSRTIKTATVADIVRRKRSTAFQSQLPIQSREDNVGDAFELVALSSQERAEFQGKHLCIVDDLCTTGSTLVAVARQLLVFKPASITAIVVARSLQ